MEPNFKEVERIIINALAEDIGKGDVTGELLIPAEARAKLSFINREPLVMCCSSVVSRVFAHIDNDIKTTTHISDGRRVPPKTLLIEVEGSARNILTAERVALNLLQRMCSVATLTALYVKAVHGTGVIILDTRKTMPGLREIDKFAVRAGGGKNHRMRLDDAMLIKDNHVALCGGIRLALERAKAGNNDKLSIEIECDTLAQVEEALAAGAERIMLDNMDVPTLKEAVKYVAGRAALEASGNVNINNVRQIAETGVDFISIGRLTHSVPNVDIGLDVVLE
jgi:nicotinate-nucleotide pyrophosphorylase (carboxylating)